MLFYAKGALTICNVAEVWKMLRYIFLAALALMIAFIYYHLVSQWIRVALNNNSSIFRRNFIVAQNFSNCIIPANLCKQTNSCIENRYVLYIISYSSANTFILLEESAKTSLLLHFEGSLFFQVPDWGKKMKEGNNSGESSFFREQLGRGDYYRIYSIKAPSL